MYKIVERVVTIVANGASKVVLTSSKGVKLELPEFRSMCLTKYTGRLKEFSREPVCVHFRALEAI